MAVNAGIKEVYLDAPNADITDVGAASVIGLGFRQNGQFIGEPFNPITDNRNREFPNLFNFRAEFNTMQLSLATMSKLVSFAKAGGASCAILTAGITKAGSPPNETISPGTGNIFIFDTTGSRSMGIDWELRLTPTERMINVTLERAFSPTDAVQILNDSTTNTLKFASNKVPMLSPNQVSSGFIIPTFVDPDNPNNVVAIPPIQLGDFSIVLSTESTKNAFNVSLPRGVKMEFTATMSQADNTVFSNWLSLATFPTADVRVTLDGSNYIEIKSLSYSKSTNFEVGDENRNAVIKLVGMLDLDFVTTTANSIVFNTYLT